MPRIRIALIVLVSALVVAAPAQAASVKGKWKGTVHVVKGGSGSFAMKMTIKHTKVGSKAGTLSNPGSPCHGTLRVSSRLKGGYSLHYHELGTTGACTGDDRIFIKRKGTHLSWRATSPNGRQVGKALLRRA